MNTIYVQCLATLLLAFTAQGQSFYNLDFEQSCDSSKTGFCRWDISWGKKGSCGPERSGDNQWLVISGETETAVGFVEQTATLTAVQGLQILTVSATISSENVKGKGAGLNVGVYDAAGTLLSTKDMGYGSFSWVRGSTEWKEYTITAICPDGAATIKIGAILYGKGNARFDDYKITFDPVIGRKPSTIAEEYIAAACDTIAKHSLRKDSIDILSLKRTALQIAGPAKTYADCHVAIAYLLESIGDHHSFFMKPEEVASWRDDTTGTVNIEYVRSRIIDSCGYIVVPPFHGGNTKLMLAYSDSMQAAIRKLDHSGIKGWVVDLRENTGGNMGPMIAGLGPMFDSEKLGSLVDVNGKKETWSYKDGTYCWETEIIMSVSSPVVLSAQRPIAVLIGPRTGSSGEIVVLSFVGNGKTRIFGQPTWGLTTGNGAFDLPDGARMMLASTIMADRNGKLYYGKIEPDERIMQSGNSQEDVEMKAAIRWIMK